MRNKNITLVVNKEDVRQLSAQALSNVLSRHARNNEKNIQALNTIVGSASSEEIKEALNQIIQNHALVAEEIHNLFPLVEEIEKLLPPDTEVLKDSLNLKEDGLGVDSGSE